MRIRIAFAAVCLFLLTAIASAQPSICVVSGTLYKSDLTPCKHCAVTVVRVTKTGSVFSTEPVTKYSDSVTGVVSLTLPRSSTAYIYAQAYAGATNLDKAGGVGLAIPNAATATLESLGAAATTPTQGLTVYDEVTPLVGLYGTFKFVGAGVAVTPTSAGVATVTITGAVASLDDLSDVVLTVPSSGQVLSYNGTNWVNGSASGSGTVTDFSAGNLSPLFTSSVATSTSTPALTFALSTQSANRVFAGPSTGSAAAPTFRALVAADIPDLSATYQTSLGFTAENITNKATGFGTLNNTLYPTTAAVNTFVAANYQPLSSVLTTYAAVAPSANVQTLLGAANYAAFRSSLGVAVGSDVQAFNSDLAAIAGLTPTNDDIIQRKAGAWVNRSLAQLKTDLSLSGSNTGDQDLSGYVPTSRTVNSKALSGNITLGLASSDFANQGTTTTILHGNAAGNPSFGQVVNADVSSSAAIALSKLSITGTPDGTKFLRDDGSWQAASGGASTALSNLASVSINASLIPQTTLDLGAAATAWRNLYIYGSGTFGSHSIKFDGAPSGNRVVTFPDSNTTVAISSQQITWSGLTAARAINLPDAAATLLSETNSTTKTPQFAALGLGVAAGSSGSLTIKGAGTTTAVNFQTQNSSGTALMTGFDNGHVWIGANPDSTDVILAIKKTTTGTGVTDIINVSNDSDANFHMGVSNTGESDKRALFGPTTNTAFAFQTNATERFRFTNAGHFIAGTDNAYDIGASGATRPRSLYLGTTIATGDPTSGAGPVWKLGSKKSATVVLVTTDYIEVSIAGVTYKLALAQ
jgi:hypothetical protein